MSESRRGDGAIKDTQSELAAFDRRLADPTEGDVVLSQTDSTDLARIDDDIVFPEAVVGKLFEMAQHPERYTEEELTASIDRAELLIQKLELRAKLSSPESLPAIVWILSAFLPKLREQIADYYRRKQQGREAAAQYKAISETVGPLIQKLRTFLDQIPKPREFSSASEKMERILSLKEKCRKLEQAYEKLQVLMTDHVFKNPIMITKIMDTSAETMAATLQNSRLSGYSDFKDHSGDMITRFRSWIDEINQHLELAHLKITPASVRPGNNFFNGPWFDDVPRLNHYNSKSGAIEFVYYDISDMTIRIAVSVAQLKEQIDVVKKELTELETTSVQDEDQQERVEAIVQK